MPPIISAIKIRAFSTVIYSMPKMDALNINNPKTRSTAPINITPNSFIIFIKSLIFYYRNYEIGKKWHKLRCLTDEPTSVISINHLPAAYHPSSFFQCLPWWWCHHFSLQPNWPLPHNTAEQGGTSVEVPPNGKGAYSRFDPLSTSTLTRRLPVSRCSLLVYWWNRCACSTRFYFVLNRAE